MIFNNFLIGLPLMLLCLVIQVLTAFWSVRYYIRHVDHQTGRPRTRTGFWPLLIAMLALMFGTFVQISLWGVLFIWLGEFAELYEAVYFSAVNFASLGYGDILMAREWQLLGPLEAINSVLMLGMSAAALMAILQHMIRSQLNRN